MLKPKKKVNFKNIWALIEQADTVMGTFLFKNPSEKITLKEKFFKLTWARHAFFFYFFMVSTLIVTNFALISVILSVSMISISIFVYIVLFTNILKKSEMKDLLYWCENLYDVENKFNTVVQNVAQIHLISMESKTTKLLKWLRIILYVDFIGFSVGTATIGHFLPEHIYSKYSAPIPFYLPFKHQDT